jgi:hypothetical protein
VVVPPDSSVVNPPLPTWLFTKLTDALANKADIPAFATAANLFIFAQSRIKGWPQSFKAMC